MTDVPIPAFLALDDEPLSDDDLAYYFDAASVYDNETGLPREMRRDPETTKAGGWRIEDDAAAEWAGRKLAAAEETLGRLREQREEWVARIDRWYQEVTRSDARTRDYMRERLEDYALRVREAGGPATITLPSVEIGTTASSPKVDVENDEVLAEFIDRVLFRSERYDPAARAWLDAWTKLVDGADEPVMLVKRSAKVYVGPFRKLVRIEKRETGAYDVQAVLDGCGHVVEIVANGLDDPDVPAVGEIVGCRFCPFDPIDGMPERPVAGVTFEPIVEDVVVGPDGAPVPGAAIDPGGIRPKEVKVRG